MNSKTELHLFFNSFHSSFFDSFFIYVTYLGDGVMPVLISLILLSVRYRYALIVGLSNVLASTITQLLKHNIYSEIYRPKKFFEGVRDIYFVPDFDNHLYHSFPSGHATCSFALYFSLALIVPNRNYKFMFFLIAIIAGYSRVYLSQHFFEDIYAGSIIGVGITIIVFVWLQKMPSQILDGSIITSFRRI